MPAGGRMYFMVCFLFACGKIGRARLLGGGRQRSSLLFILCYWYH